MSEAHNENELDKFLKSLGVNISVSVRASPDANTREYAVMFRQNNPDPTPLTPIISTRTYSTFDRVIFAGFVEVVTKELTKLLPKGYQYEKTNSD